MFHWKETNDVELFKDILNLVEPYKIERDAILECIKRNIVYKSYVAINDNKDVIALIIATFLPRTKTILIEDFALHPNFRERGYAKKLWNDWRNFVRVNWINVEALCIEVYLHNVEAWEKIMQVKKLFPQYYSLDLAPHSKVYFMGKDLTSTAEAVLIEWKQICYNTQNLFKANL